MKEFVIVTHGNINDVLIADFIFHLLKALVFKIETVFQEPVKVREYVAFSPLLAFATSEVIMALPS